MSEFLKHPLTILLVGALVSGLLIPELTRRWQNQQKALEIKTQLVSDLSKSITEMMMAIQFAHLGARSQQQADFDHAYREWEIQSAVVGTKLQAYYADTTIPDEWREFAALVTAFYALEGVNPNERPKFEADIRKRLGALRAPEPSDQDQWGELRNGILKRKAELIHKVLGTRISVLG